MEVRWAKGWVHAAADEACVPQLAPPSPYCYGKGHTYVGTMKKIGNFRPELSSFGVRSPTAPN
eukprot:1142474-Pelagomonas_calceolata.AAC.1